MTHGPATDAETRTDTAVSALLAWSDRNRRDLPWRRTRDPWAVLVSELMLQQTQVARVVPCWHRFLERFPTPEVCAAAGPGAVVEEWAGLGYNRRALNLHRVALICMERHGGRLPRSLDDLLGLPGVGPYTARAVAAFAYEDDVAVVDTNVGRLLARWVTGRRLTGRHAQAEADNLVPAGEGWAWNQAMLDLGATVCVARAPRCADCPVERWCAWRSRGGPDSDDPARGSHAVSRGQSRFEGSDRQGRGRLVDALRRRPLPRREVAEAAGWPGDPDRAQRILIGLEIDGLAVIEDDWVRLPGPGRRAVT